MKFLYWILFFLAPIVVIGQGNDLQNMSVLASQYYQNKEYAKAAEMYEKLYATTKADVYFNIYLDCLIGIPDYEKAEKEIRKGLRGNSGDSFWYIQWGFLKKTLGQSAESEKLYQRALEALSSNTSEYPNLANQFLNRREYEYAEKVYQKGRSLQGNGLYCYELARVYYYMRNYDQMMKEYLDWLKQRDANLEIVKSNIMSVLAMDNDQEISRQIKSYVLKRIQQEPDQVVFNRLLIWLFIQDKNFTAAIRQAIALDRRTGGEDGSIFGLANVAASNRNYDEAARAYDYIIAKGRKTEYYSMATIQQVQMEYDRFVSEAGQDKVKAELLTGRFKQVIETLGLSAETTGLLSEYAHLLAFYLGRTDEAIKLLNDGLALPGINMAQLSILKAELSDIYVYAGDLWEAVITYSQVIESNKSTPLGDEVKFRKAKLGYYMGNFQWAKAQLDALRASTSKLIANDAMELALFIGENLETDSTTAPLQLFARADLNLFRNDHQAALATLDSITSQYPYNSLSDDVNFRKAGIFVREGKFAEAAELYQSVVKDYSWDLLADDALFQLAGIYQNKLNRKQEAMDFYKKMLTDYPGSVYVVDSRNEYRKIQEELKPVSLPDSTPAKPVELTRP